MCQQCVEMYKQMNPKIEATMDRITTEVSSLIDMVLQEIPDEIKTGAFNTETGQPLDLSSKPELMTDEEYQDVLKIDSNVRRAMAIGLIAGYMSCRYLKTEIDPQEEMIIFHSCEDMMALGAKHGHVIREALPLINGKPN